MDDTCIDPLTVTFSYTNFQFDIAFNVFQNSLKNFNKLIWNSWKYVMMDHEMLVDIELWL